MKNFKGTVSIEFALLAPLLVLLLLGSMELSRFILINQKLEIATAAMADLATQQPSASRTALKQIADAADILMQPYSMQGSIIFTSATNARNDVRLCRHREVCILWQYEPMGRDKSRIGRPGGAPALPGGYQIGLGQDVIVAEIFYVYQPLFAGTAALVPALKKQTLYYSALYKPRQGKLLTLN